MSDRNFLKELDDCRQEIYDENQAALPMQDRGGPLYEPICGEMNDGYTCTKILGHLESLEHVAHGSLGTIEHRWNGPVARVEKES